MCGCALLVPVVAQPLVPVAAQPVVAVAASTPLGPPSAVPPLRVGYLQADAPYSQRNAVGVAEGLSVALLRAVLQRAGLRLQDLVPLSRDAAMPALLAGQVDLLLGAVPEPVADARLLLLGPYQRSPLAIVSAERLSLVNPASLAGQPVAVAAPPGLRQALLAQRPQLQLLPAADDAQALAWLAEGRVVAVVGGLHTLNEQLRDARWQALRLTGWVPDVQDQRYLALLASRADLAAHLGPAMRQVLGPELAALEQGWAQRRLAPGVDWVAVRRWAMPATALAGLLLLGWWLHGRVLRRERARTQAARDQATQLLNFLAIEVRTVLQSVRGALALWRRPAADAAPAGLVEALAQAATATVARLDGLLDRQRLQARSLGLQRRPESLDAVVQDIVDELQPLARDRGHDLVYEPSGGQLEGWLVDAFRLQQVLRHLVRHALGGAEPGVVMLEMAMQHSPLGADWGLLVVAVSDQGPDLDVGTRQQLFEQPLPTDSLLPEDPPTPRENQGLRLARDLVQAMGGTLRMEPRPVRGNCFILHLNLQRAEGHNATARPLQRVLLVEDARAYGLLLQHALAQVGVAAVLVDSLAAAQTQLAASDPLAPPFELLLCDSHLPDGGLAELLALGVQRRAQGQHMPAVVGMASDFQTDDIQRLTQLGAADLLTKDGDLPDLVRRLQRSWLTLGQA